MKAVIYKAAKYNPYVKIGSGTYKQKWFSADCIKARKCSFKYLKLFRKTGDDIVRKLYLQANCEYKRLCHDAKEAYYKSVGERLRDVKDIKEWWKILRELKQKDFRYIGNISIDDFVQHFQALFNPVLNVNPYQYAEPLLYDDLLDELVTLDEVKNVLRIAKNGKAPGIDRIPIEFYKYANDDFLRLVVAEFNKYLEFGVVPDSFKISIICPLHKKGNVDEPTNYRGLSFIDSICKIFTGMLSLRLSEWADAHNILKECQAGFRRMYSTVDNVFSLCSIIKYYQLRVKKKIYGFYVDLKSAFDSIDRSALFYKLINMGVSSKFVKVLRNLYTGMKATVWDGVQLSKYFSIEMGVRQGDLPSPILFNLFINDLEDALGDDGIEVDEIKVKLLMCADDIIIFAEDVEMLQRMITKLSKYCDNWNMNVNLTKSKVMIFNAKGRRAKGESWKYKGEPIEIVSCYKYLGVVVTPNLDFRKHLSERLNMAKTSINSAWNVFVNKRNVKLSDKFRLFETVARSIMCYAAQIWGYEEYEEVEKLLRFFVRRLFYLAENTPNYMIYIETRMNKLFLYTLKLQMNYVIKVLGMSDHRLPKKLACKCIQHKIFWVPAIADICDKVGVEINISSTNANDWRGYRREVLLNLERWTWERLVTRARMSNYHDIYYKLEYHAVDYFGDDLPWEAIKLIFEARGGLLDLNARAWKKNTTGICSLCNMDVPENTFHFVAECPILSEFRMDWFGVTIMDEKMFYSYMNGADWTTLYKYIRRAYEYRKFLVAEFNC